MDNSPLDRTKHTVSIPIEDYERLKSGLERYEFVRCLSVQQFSQMLFERNVKEGIPFDELVDIEMAWDRKKREMRRHEEIQQGVYETWTTT